MGGAGLIFFGIILIVSGIFISIITISILFNFFSKVLSLLKISLKKIPK